MPTTLKTLNGFALALCLSLSAAATADVQALRENLAHIKSFSANFSQRLVSAISPRAAPQTSRGRVIFKRPGMFRWSYETPFQQEIISDGFTLWVYDKDLEQVTIRPADSGPARSPIAILDNPDDIPDLYRVELLNAPGRQIKLTPLYENAGFKFVVLAFADKQLLGMQIHDNFHQYSNLVFDNIKANVAIDDMRFSFTPPPDVDVINAASFE